MNIYLLNYYTPNETKLMLLQAFIIILIAFVVITIQKANGKHTYLAGVKRVIDKKHFDKDGNPIGFKMMNGIPVDTKGNNISHLLDWELERVYKEKSTSGIIANGFLAILGYGVAKGVVNAHRKK